MTAAEASPAPPEPRPDPSEADPLANDQPLLEALYSASVAGHTTTQAILECPDLPSRAPPAAGTDAPLVKQRGGFAPPPIPPAAESCALPRR